MFDDGLRESAPRNLTPRQRARIRYGALELRGGENTPLRRICRKSGGNRKNEPLKKPLL